MVPSAGAKFKTFDVILAPFAVDEAEIAPTLVTALDVDQAGDPLTKVKNWPSVPFAKRVPVPDVPP